MGSLRNCDRQESINEPFCQRRAGGTYRCEPAEFLDEARFGRGPEMMLRVGEGSCDVFGDSHRSIVHLTDESFSFLFELLNTSLSRAWDI